MNENERFLPSPSFLSASPPRELTFSSNSDSSNSDAPPSRSDVGDVSSRTQSRFRVPKFNQLNLYTKFALLFYGVAFGVMAVVGYYGYKSTDHVYRTKAEELQIQETAKITRSIEEFLELAREDAQYHTFNHDVLRYAYWNDFDSPEKAATWRNDVIATLRNFSDAYPYVYKNRLINLKGMEAISVRRPRHAGETEIIPDERMNDQSQADFFLKAKNLQRGEVYISDVVFSENNGRIETPFIPVIHFSTPLIGNNNATLGVLTATVFADRLFNYITAANRHAESRRYFLIDSSGNYLVHPNSEKTFGHLLNHTANFRIDFPATANQIDKENEGLMWIQGKIINFKKIYPSIKDPSRHWVLIGVADENEVLAEVDEFTWMFRALSGLVGVLIIIITQLFLRKTIQPLSFVTKQLRRLSLGEVGVTIYHYKGNDEIRQMLDSTEHLLINIERIATYADQISNGDLSRRVPLLSPQDRLGKALNNMVDMLRASKQKDICDNWVKDSVNQLNYTLSSEFSLRRLADAAIGITGRTLSAGRGVFYVLDAEQQRLELIGSYMHNERDTLGATVQFGEGAIGQVAHEMKPIILRLRSENTYANSAVETGTSRTIPNFIYAYPLLRENELLGVIELDTFEKLQQHELDYLTRATEVVSSFLYSVKQRDRIQKLLNAAKAEARRANEANAMMETQQQHLQRQTEELLHANALMEEQQQQLHQQAEELQMANAQMEEQQRQLEIQKQELEYRNTQLISSHEEIIHKAEQLEAASRYKSEFLANMSHELRTPLNSIILLSKMLAVNDDRRLNEEDTKRASIILQAGEELLRLINDILDLSKIEAGRMEIVTQELEIEVLIHEIRYMFEPMAQEKNLEFRIEIMWQGQFLTDHDKLSQILRNLLSNAVKFTREGCVSVHVERVEGEPRPIRISVRDTGIGIPPNKQELIFQAFQQVDGSVSREFGGTGLGLTISQKFAELLGGRIMVESQEGVGSNFILHLPDQPPIAIHQPETTSNHLETAPPPPPTLSGYLPQGPKPAPFFTPHPEDDRNTLHPSDIIILIIEDDPIFSSIVTEMNHALGHKSIIATNGREGVHLARTYRPKGILLDLGLPDMDGIEVLHELKTAFDLRNIPVYIISGRVRDQSLNSKDILGYLHKPIDQEQLSTAIENIITQVEATNHVILVLSGEALKASDIDELLKNRAALLKNTSRTLNIPASLKVIEVSSVDEALSHLQSGATTLITIDFQRNENIVETCRRLHHVAPNVPLILFGVKPLTEEETLSLTPYTSSIITRAPRAELRMLENIEHFLENAARPPERHHTPRLPPFDKFRPLILSGRNILVVDDDPRNLFVITSALEQAGAKVYNALSGTKALNYLNDNSPDLIFMDLMMPDLNGFETIRRIRNTPTKAGTPIVVLSAKAMRADREEAMISGADDFLAKPIDYELLVSTAATWCEGRRR
ncbi:Histidine kinase [Azospirillaceae bacterium]